MAARRAAKPSTMKEMTRDELKAKLDRGERFDLVMTLGEFAFRGKHIPGSLNLHEPEDLLAKLDPQQETVVYCSDRLCPSSIMAYHFLDSRGYTKLWRYSGGLSEWEQAGYPLEGELVGQAPAD
jgi:rhodanese-related sulfurtransferase